MSADPLVVAVDGGLVAGVREAGGVHAFRGIPYAAAPTGARRWRAPQPVEPWVGVRPAAAFGPQCVQPARAADSVYAEYAGVQPMAEDCLFVNVFTPADDAGARLPVLVWIHGGAFQQGAGSNPVFVQGDLPRQGIVLVTLNYRLGPFGFFAHSALTAESGTSGLCGLLDIEAALGWVQRRIGGFGGDPARVTIAGQSAGAEAVVDLLAAARTRGLYARAIAQSFGVTPARPLAEAERRGEALAAALGVAAGTNHGEALAALRAQPADAVLAACVEHSLRFMPVTGGALLPRSARDVFAEGRENPVPLLAGWNADEGSAFPAAADAAAFRARLQARFGDAAADAAALWPARDDATARAASRELFGDDLFAWGVWRAARDHARVAPTWLYHYAQPQPFAPDQRFREAERPADLGAFHSAEYPHVFGTTHVLTRDWRESDRRTTARMQALWLSFVRHGDPCADAAAATDDVPAWPRFVDGEPTVLRLAEPPSLVDVPRRDRIALLDRTDRDDRPAP